MKLLSNPIQNGHQMMSGHIRGRTEQERLIYTVLGNLVMIQKIDSWMMVLQCAIRIHGGMKMTFREGKPESKKVFCPIALPVARALVVVHRLRMGTRNRVPLVELLHKELEGVEWEEEEGVGLAGETANHLEFLFP